MIALILDGNDDDAMHASDCKIFLVGHECSRLGQSGVQSFAMQSNELVDPASDQKGPSGLVDVCNWAITST